MGIDNKTRILIGVSGGMDSMTLLHLVHNLGYHPEVAHINYHLRGRDSDLDQQLIETYCAKSIIPLHISSFKLNTSEKSIQNEARNLRFNFFKQLIDDRNFDCVLLGHHANDRIETSLFNFFRGTGLKGVASMSSRSRRYYLRPLLDVFKKDIEIYADQYMVPFRSDHSNYEEKYARNYIRNSILPLISGLFSNFEVRSIITIQNLQADLQLLNAFISSYRKNIFNDEGTYISMDLDSILSFDDPPLLVFHLLQDYAFSSSDIIQLLNGDLMTGKYIESSHYRLYVDRGKLLLFDRAALKRPVPLIIHSLPAEKRFGRYSLKFEWIDKEEYKNGKQEEMLILDGKNLLFPLLIRPWQPGDRIAPSKMKGNTKKVKDMLTEYKIPLPLKQSTPVIQDDSKRIVAVFPISEDYKYRPTKKSNKLLRITGAILQNRLSPEQQDMHP
jgi:tRNA(Ile)-lysidine synthase